MLANALQLAGLAVLCVGVGFACGWAIGAALAGSGLLVYGIALERGK